MIGYEFSFFSILNKIDEVPPTLGILVKQYRTVITACELRLARYSVTFQFLLVFLFKLQDNMSVLNATEMLTPCIKTLFMDNSTVYRGVVQMMDGCTKFWGFP